MKIAICGCAGIGKTTLMQALAAQLNSTSLDEHYGALFSPPGTFNGEPEKLVPLFIQVLDQKHALQDQAGKFVVDRAGIDLLNLWMARGLSRFEEATQYMVNQCRQYLQHYDLVVFPPWGAIPLVPHDTTDGRVRVQDPWVQLRNHAAILGFARLWLQPEKLLCLPESATTVEQRVALVQQAFTQ